jgi:DNA modification methylase
MEFFEPAECGRCFVCAIVEAFREVRRVLRGDGVAWINLGDSYASNPGNGRGGEGSGFSKSGARPHRGARNKNGCGLKPKNLIGIPWRVAFGLQADGWWLRSAVVWDKPNALPESVKDRPAASHEYVFLLSKSPRYFYDAEAVKGPAVGGPARDGGAIRRGARKALHGPTYSRHRSSIPGGQSLQASPDGRRNLRTVWTIPTSPYRGAHFATFPRRLVEPCIRAGTSERGCCPACGAPWRRLVETTYENPGNRTTNGPRSAARRHETAGFPVRLEKRTATIGWRPSCPCDAGDPIPAVVLDPFVGVGTTLLVTESLGRRGVGCDLSRDYLAMARRRIADPRAKPPRPAREDDPYPLFATEGA